MKRRWPPAPPGLIDVFQQAMAAWPEAQVRKMFGYPCAFVQGRMLAGLYRSRMVLRLADPDRRALRRSGAKPFEPRPGQPMREYVVVPPGLLKSPARLQTWIGRALSYTKSLPPKRPKTPAST